MLKSVLGYYQDVRQLKTERVEFDRHKLLLATP